MARQRRTFTPEFKLQMVRLFENGKSKSDIVREYDLTPSALDKWIKHHQNSGSFNAADNLTNDEKEIRCTYNGCYNTCRNFEWRKQPFTYCVCY